MNMQTVLHLLPYRLEQAVLGTAVRKALTRHRRASSEPHDHSTSKVQRIFVDVSVISKHDAGTGIQRVVRALALGLVEHRSMLGCELHYVMAGHETPYHTITWPEGHNVTSSAQMEGRPGDVFIGLDYSLDDIRWNSKQLTRFRRQGGKLWFLVHDLLPLEKPEWFSRNTVIRYRAWFNILARLADGFLCNSTQTGNELKLALKRVYGIDDGYAMKVLPMGYQILKEERVKTGPNRLSDLLSSPSSKYFLQVGTLEPRKGHSDVLAAFDILWTDGFTDALVFVGQKGWQVDDLYGKITTHPLYERKLFWFDDVEDPELDQLYQGCKGSIIASFAEGFGLPLIEALGHQKPVLARDLQVFRQHQGCGVEYFSDVRGAAVLADRIRQWSDDIAKDRITVSPPEKGWHDSVAELIDAVT